MKLNLAICDNEEQALKEEYDLVSSVLTGLEIEYYIDIFSNPEELIKSQVQYNIIFLDIEMEELSGIETANIIRENNRDCFIFFVTNYERYLDDALDKRAFRFWTKPLDKRRLSVGLESAIKEIKSLQHYITVKINGTKSTIFLHNIIYIYMENKRLHVITAKGEITTDDTLKTIYNQIKSIDYFTETCRGYYVNMNYVKNYSRENIVCSYKQEIYNVSVSRRKYNSFHHAFISWVGGK